MRPKFCFFTSGKGVSSEKPRQVCVDSIGSSTKFVIVSQFTQVTTEMLTKKKDPKTWNSNGTTTGKYLKKEAPSDVPSKYI
jgi:hypothetical protein